MANRKAAAAKAQYLSMQVRDPPPARPLRQLDVEVNAVEDALHGSAGIYPDDIQAPPERCEEAE